MRRLVTSAPTARISRTITIRLVSNSELPELIKLHRKFCKIHAGLFPERFVLKSAEQIGQTLKEALRDPQVDFIGAQVNGQLVGYLRARYHTLETEFSCVTKIVYIEQLFVSSPFRKRGIGRQLLEKIVTLGAARGVKRIELDVFEGNEAARNFYLAHRFIPVTRRLSLTLLQ